MYLLAILFPPLAVLMCGKPMQALMNVLFMILLYVPAVIHAVLIVKEYKDDQRMKKQVEMMKK